MDAQAILELVTQHKWFAVAALLIGLCVRVLKSDSPLPTVPPAWRPWLALGFGAVSGILDRIVQGTSWKDALLSGLASAMVAIVGHETVVESMRNGRELFTGKPPSSPPPLPPKAEKKVVADDDTEKAVISPPTTLRKKASWSVLTFRLPAFASLAVLLGCLAMNGGCKDPKFASELKNAVLTVEQVACVLVQSELGTQAPALVTSACQIAPDFTQDVAQVLMAHQKAKAKLAAIRASKSSDAGAESGTTDAAVATTTVTSKSDAGSDGSK